MPAKKPATKPAAKAKAKPKGAPAKATAPLKKAAPRASPTTASVAPAPKPAAPRSLAPVTPETLTAPPPTRTAPPAPEPAPVHFSEPAAPVALRDGTVVVVLDASSLFLPFQFRVDPVAETKRLVHKPLEFVVPEPVAEEIRRVLTMGFGRSKRDAKAALQYAEKFTHRAGRGQGDDSVLNMAIDERHAGRAAVIVTTDVGLRRRARAFKVPVLFMRSKGHLMLDGYIE